MEIYLNVYDLHDSNQYLHTVGSGFYHSGVEIQGYEYSFSNHGIARTRPQLTEFGRLRDHILLGTFTGSMAEINQYISILSSGDFQPGTYNITTRNCNHFSDALSMLVLNVHIPAWVNRMANIASSLPGKKDAAAPATDEFAAPGKVKDPSLPVKVETSSTPSTADTYSTSSSNSSFLSSIFNWFGSTTPRQEKSIATSTPQITPSTTSSTPCNVNVVMKYNNSSTTKKELTAEQKRLLAKVKGSKD